MKSLNAGMLALLSVLCFVTVGRGQTAATQDQLLDRLDELWQQFDRQPTSDEIANGSDYTADQYLQAWETWDGTRTALAEHLYQKGVLASLQNDRPTALVFLRRCLAVNPQHSGAISSYNRLNKVDLNQALAEQSGYTNELAGRESVQAYRLFSMAMSRGNEPDAEQFYLRARRLKQEYSDAEVERLQGLLSSAIILYDQGDFKSAVRQFEELDRVTAAHAGYDQVVKPAAGDIGRYLQQTQTAQNDVRVSSVRNVTRSSKLMVWLSASYFGAQSDLGVEHTGFFLRQFRMNTGAFLGPDLGLVYRVTNNIWAGASWSWMVRSPTIKYQAGVFQADAPMNGASVHAVSALIQPGGYISDQIRIFGQAGVSLIKAKMPATLLPIVNVAATTTAVTESPIGFFFGAGSDLWNTTIGNVGWGFRFDARYHIVQTKIQAPAAQKLELNGLRVGAGMIFAFGGSR